METDGGGWTVFQRRIDGSVDFYLNWIDYVSNLNGRYGVDSQGKGVTWNTWRGWQYSLLFTEMKTRRS